VLDRPAAEELAKQVVLVCTGLIAMARSRPTAFAEITASGVREFPLWVDFVEKGRLKR
jgi:hypothetical protein